MPDNTPSTQVQVSAATLETVLGTGNLADLTPTQRVEYMSKTCQSLGLNPLTRPFRFIRFPTGEVQMYPTRDCADQLRNIRRISLQILDQRHDSGLYIVQVRASMPDGRHDEDLGAVPLDKQQGEWRSNAIMKAITKAKRRVTLSICGLGHMDESEIESVISTNGGVTFDAEAPTPPVPEAPKPPLTQYAQQVQQEVAKPPATKRTIREYLDQLARDLDACQSMLEVDTLWKHPDTDKARAHFKDAPLDEFNKLFRDAYDRVATQGQPKAEPPITGSEVPF